MAERSRSGSAVAPESTGSNASCRPGGSITSTGRVRRSGAIAFALPAMMPPPFPLTPFVLTCGALAVSKTRFFLTLGIVRLVRFGIEATLAVIYGQRILGWMKSDLFQAVVIGFTIVAVAVSVAGIWTLIRQSRKAERAAPRAA